MHVALEAIEKDVRCCLDDSHLRFHLQEVWDVKHPVICLDVGDELAQHQEELSNGLDARQRAALHDAVEGAANSLPFVSEAITT